MCENDIRVMEILEELNATKGPPILNPCVVCGAEANKPYKDIGIVCTSCPHFFNYYTRVDTTLECPNNRNCIIDNTSRTTCRYCRFQKCLAVGMTRPKPREPAPTLFEVRYPIPESEFDKVVSKVRQANEACKKYTVFSIRSRDMKYVPSKTPLRKRKSAWGAFSKEIHTELNEIVHFANDLPGGDLLTKHERITLLQANIFPIFLLRNAFGFRENGLMLPNGCFVNRKTLKVLYGDLADNIVSIAEEIRKLRCSLFEMYIFIAYVFYKFPDDTSPEVEKKDNVLIAAQYYRNVLHQKFPSDENGTEIFDNLMEMAKKLEKINQQHNETYVFLCKSNGSFREDNIFMKAFGIPESFADDSEPDSISDQEDEDCSSSINSEKKSQEDEEELKKPQEKLGEQKDVRKLNDSTKNMILHTQSATKATEDWENVEEGDDEFHKALNKIYGTQETKKKRQRTGSEGSEKAKKQKLETENLP